jgi:hypothetical protein
MQPAWLSNATVHSNTAWRAAARLSRKLAAAGELALKPSKTLRLRRRLARCRGWPSTCRCQAPRGRRRTPPTSTGLGALIGVMDHPGPDRAAERAWRSARRATPGRSARPSRPATQRDPSGPPLRPGDRSGAFASRGAGRPHRRHCDRPLSGRAEKQSSRTERSRKTRRSEVGRAIGSPLSKRVRAGGARGKRGSRDQGEESAIASVERSFRAAGRRRGDRCRGAARWARRYLPRPCPPSRCSRSPVLSPIAVSC